MTCADGPSPLRYKTGSSDREGPMHESIQSTFPTQQRCHVNLSSRGGAKVEDHLAVVDPVVLPPQDALPVGFGHEGAKLALLLADCPAT